MSKQHKILRRTAATFLATAMMASLTAVPALAEPVESADNTGVTEGSSFTITKYLTKEAKTMTPNVSFTFTVSTATVTNEVRNNIPVSSGIAGGVTVSDTDDSADFAPNETLDDSTQLSDTVTFDVNLTSFGGVPGIYKYTIEEDAVSYDGITKDNNVLNLYVYIQNTSDGGVEVAYTELVDPDGGEDGTSESKTDSFTNDYDSNGTQLYELTLYKVITGNAANRQDEFKFTVKVDGEMDEHYYAVYGTYTAEGGFVESENSVVLTSGTSSTITLGNNDAIKIYGLDSNDTYTITEVDDNTNGYTLKINDEEDEDGVTTGTISADSIVKYENNKDASTPTGIIRDIAPYALLVVAAAGACVIFLRKRTAE